MMHGSVPATVFPGRRSLPARPPRTAARWAQRRVSRDRLRPAHM